MFGFLIRNKEERLDALQTKIERLEMSRDAMIDEHAREKQRLNDALIEERNKLADLERKRKHESEDIAHLVKLKESKLDLDFGKRALELEREKERAIAAVKDEYRNKLEAQLQKQLEDMRKMYSEILARLPNVNVKLTGNAGG